MCEAFDTPRSRLARSVVRYLVGSPNHPYATLNQVSLNGSFDMLEIELEIELAQRRPVPIQHKEPVRLTFMAHDDSWPPRVLSTRENFPTGMVHTNLDREAGGLALCIWEEAWPDLSTNLTGQALVERLRSWFSSMAAGTVHDDEQLLEPLILASSHTLIIPPGEMHGPWYIQQAYKHEGQMILGLSKEKPERELTTHNFAIYAPQLPGQQHGALARTPYDLGALQQLCLNLGFDLIRDLTGWLQAPDQLRDADRLQPILVLTVPKRRERDAPEEQLELWCYTLGESLAQLGERLDITITDQKTKQTTYKLLGTAENADLPSIALEPWRVVQRLDRGTARQFAGATNKTDTPLLAIGAGAIGSNVAMMVTRSGIGPWTVVDGDITLPHNTVRQVHKRDSVGYPKALGLQFALDNVFEEGGNTAIPVNVFAPGEQADALDAAVRSSEIAIDFSASPAVLGWLSEQPIRRGVSAFFGPDGSDLVVLAENKSRAVRVDEIEAQYFWHVATEAQLKGHLSAARLDKIRYANACQDLSAPLPPWQLQTLCGLAAGQVARLLQNEDACFQVWRLEPVTGAVQPVVIPVQQVHRYQEGTVRVSITSGVISTMRKLRREAGGNETGGVLIGTFDLVRNVVHIVAALPAPPDSKQAPTYFVRGKKDLKPRIEELSSGSAGRLHYLGEWHSHPRAVPARPSDDDEGVFSHLEAHLGSLGGPYIMAICGEDDTWIRTGWAEHAVVEGVITHEPR